MEGIGILVWLIGIAVEVLSIVFSEKTEPCRHKKGYMIACAIFNGLGLLVCVLGIINDMPKDIMLVTYGIIDMQFNGLHIEKAIPSALAGDFGFGFSLCCIGALCQQNRIFRPT